MLDPGLGFAKRGEHNWRLLADLEPIKALGYPLLVGASRKSFLGTLLAGPDGDPAPVDDRDDATTALSVVLAAGRGVGRSGCTTYAPPATPCGCWTHSTTAREEG